MCRALRVLMHRPLQIKFRLKPIHPIAVELIRRLALHPGREAFVQPQIVPPLHGHQVAEPLMRHLVGNDDENPLTIRLRGPLRVQQQLILEVEDRTPVLHSREPAPARRRDHVELGQRVRDAKILVIETKQFDRAFECELPVFRASRFRNDGDDSGPADLAHPLQVSNA